ncbi:MAG: conjugal transfer protein TraI [Parvularcula sp.]|nr:conjugal transfer protein TraI [Parvularcula sp.]
MSDDAPFTPRLGKPRDVGRAGGRRFKTQLKRAAARLSQSGSRKAFTGAHIGRGSAAGRAASFRRHPFAKFRMRRVIIKTHIARAGKGIGKAAFKAHLKYIQRDGVDRDGHGGALYSANRIHGDDRDFIARSEDDRHQFRVIVSPEDADQLGDLKQNTRTLMAQMEKDLGTKLDWVAVDHYNTGHPHTHIVIRGKDARGKDLVIAREYLTKGMRQRASDIVTEHLGPRRDLEIAQSQAKEVDADRFTHIDQRLAQDTKDNLVQLERPDTAHGRFEQTLTRRRLQHLEKLQLAEQNGASGWRLKNGWKDALQAMGRKGDKIRELAAASRDDFQGPRAIFEPSVSMRKSILGRVVSDGPENELQDRRYLIVDDVDGTRWHVSIGSRVPGTLPPPDAIVEVTALPPKARRADHIIARIAALNDGLYSDDLHADTDPTARTEYRRAHVRRLEALRRAGIVNRDGDGQFHLPSDYLDRAAIFEATRNGSVQLKVKSWIGLSDQVERHAPTWLDDVSSADNWRSGFGNDAAKAKAARIRFLHDQGWAAPDGGLDADQRQQLATNELTRAAQAHSGGGAYVPLPEGAEFDGVYERSINLAQGRFAVIAKSKEFTLVPWRPELERNRGATLTVRKTAGGIDWTVGKSRGIGR